MRESDLYIPVRDWLAARGYTIHVEIFGADIVAVKDGRLLAVELKLCNSGVLMRQLHGNATWADEVMAAIATVPRSTKAYSYHGYGLLLVASQKVRQRIKPRPQPWHRIKRRAYRLGILEHRNPAMAHEVAGLPSCSELREQRLLRDDVS